MSQNVNKKAFSVAALSLCYPINEKLPWLRRKFAGTGSDKTWKGTLERKLARWGSIL
jgi:hypothetical protein